MISAQEILRGTTTLISLDLTGWNMSFVPACLEECTTLTSLNLSSWFRLTSIPFWLLTTMHLRHLDITFSQVTNLPTEWMTVALVNQETRLHLGNLIDPNDVEHLARRQPHLAFTTADALRCLDRPYWSFNDRRSWTFHLAQCGDGRGFIAGPAFDFDLVPPTYPPYSPYRY